MVNVVAFGECMIEVTGSFDVPAPLGVAGDTFNTAVYLARLGADVAYATALGDDQWSRDMRAAWQREGVSDALALAIAGKQPGIYAIRTDATGDRHFTYWRQTSAVRDFFTHAAADAVLDRIAGAGLFYLSGITLSLFGAADRARLFEAAQLVRRNGGLVAFDSN